MKTMVVAVQDVPAVLVRNQTTGICKGERFTVKKNFFRNGEGWYRFTNGTEVPDVFFDEV